MNTPLTVGVTGHRDLRREDLPLLRSLVHDELERISLRCSGSQPIMLSSLAAGADCLCAEEALKLGFRLICPFPVEEEIFKKDFTDDELLIFEALRDRADDTFVSPWFEEGDGGRSFRFRQAGIYIAAHSNVLLALWDGSPAKPGGCGTAEAVDFMLNRSYETSATASEGGPVIQIVTPRISKTDAPEIRVMLHEIYPGQLDSILKLANGLNK